MRSDSCSSSARSQQRSSGLPPCPLAHRGPRRPPGAQGVAPDDTRAGRPHGRRGRSAASGTSPASFRGLDDPSADRHALAARRPRSEAVPSSADGPSRRPQQEQDQSDHQQDDPDGPQDRDLEEQSQDQQNRSEDDHFISMRSRRRRRRPEQRIVRCPGDAAVMLDRTRFTLSSDGEPTQYRRSQVASEPLSVCAVTSRTDRARPATAPAATTSPCLACRFHRCSAATLTSGRGLELRTRWTAASLRAGRSSRASLVHLTRCGSCGSAWSG